MDRPRQQFLAGARFPLQQNRRSGGRDPRDLRQRRLKRGAVPDDLGEIVRRVDLLPQVDVLVLEPGLETADLRDAGLPFVVGPPPMKNAPQDVRDELQAVDLAPRPGPVTAEIAR